MELLPAEWHSVLATMLSFNMMLIIFLGTLFGVIIGALPGLTSTMGVALLVPVTFGMPAAEGLALLGAIYCSSTYSGSISAILLNIPGTPSNCCTLIDGYPMTQKGEASRALALSTIGSAVGGFLSIFALLFLAPPLAELALQFGPQEYFVIALFGVSVIGTMSRDNMIKGLISGFAGLFFSIIGMHPLSGDVRFTFGLPELFNGLPLVTALIGLYSIPEVVAMLHQKGGAVTATSMGTGVWRHMREILKYKLITLRATVIGIIIGIIPGVGQNIASFIAYDDAKRASKHPEAFGTGTPEGIVASETANNAVVGGSLIPALTLGIPGNAVSAVMISGLMIQGLNPGPTLFTENAGTVYAFICTLFISNLIFIPVGLFVARYGVSLIRTPVYILAPLVLCLATIGAYAINNSMVDIWIMLVVGILGCVMRFFDMPREPMVLGLVLGTMAEGELARALALVRGDTFALLANMFTSPICLLMFAFTAYTLWRAFRPATPIRK